MIVKVTEEHIEKGIREDCLNCPVALAIYEMLPYPYSPSVSTRHNRGAAVVLSNKDDVNWNLLIPIEGDVIYDFIMNFDNGYYVEPFEFELKVRFNEGLLVPSR